MVATSIEWQTAYDENIKNNQNILAKESKQQKKMNPNLK